MLFTERYLTTARDIVKGGKSFNCKKTSCKCNDCDYAMNVYHGITYCKLGITIKVLENMIKECQAREERLKNAIANEPKDNL